MKFGGTRTPAALFGKALLAGALLVLAAACSPNPTELNVTVRTSSSVNPNADSQPSPIVVRIYALKSTKTFEGADFFALFDTDSKTLGGDMLDKKEFEMAPGKSEQYKAKVSDESEFVGVMAGYRDINNATWQATMPIKPNATNNVDVKVELLSVSVAPPPSSWWWPF